MKWNNPAVQPKRIGDVALYLIGIIQLVYLIFNQPLLRISSHDYHYFITHPQNRFLF